MRVPSSEPIVVLVLGQAGALSGGDVHALRLVEEAHRRFGDAVLLVGPPTLGGSLEPSARSALSEITTPFDGHMRRSALALAAGIGWRVTVAVPRLRHAAIVVASSHLIFDVVPLWIAVRIWRLPSASFVYHLIRTMDRPSGPARSIATALEAVSLRMLRNARSIVFVDNRETLEELVRLGFDPERVHTTSNAYDPSVAVPDPVGANPPRILFIGRLVDQKGIWDILELGVALASNGLPHQIDLIGDGPRREDLQRRIADDSIENVHVLGFVDEATKWASMGRCALFVAPSREEGWGIAVGEALLAGVPVVAMDLPAYEHFGERISRVSEMTTEAFVDSVLELLSEPSTFAAARTAALEGRASLPRWSDVLEEDLQVLEGSAWGGRQR